MSMNIGDRAFVGDADGYPEWADAEVEVLGITPSPLGDEGLALAHVRNVQTGAETELFVFRLEPIIDLAPADEDETFYVVHDAEGLLALPVGARLRDREGDLLIHDGVTLSAGDVADLAETYGPFILLNPECLDATDESGASADESLAELEKELLGIVPSAVDFNAEASKVTVEQNDIEREVTPTLLRAVMSALRPGERVKVVDGEVRVFMPDGKADVVYLKPGSVVTVVEASETSNAGGTYMAGRTVKVRFGDMEQWIDVTSLHPLTDEQRQRVTEVFEALLAEDIDEFIAQAEAEEAHPGLSSAKDDLEAIEAALPESPVARRAGLIGIAQGIVESMNYEATPIIILEYARFLAGDFDGEE